ncbi:hypothetical protein HBH56_055810 [Parastagonospora nodorum]|uniref:Uncharacterized protein n=2 Tax=Phaeosphaeria nodorum (strain SN15 / ATCC MYA-4574 / FGSC 10173) TaxID=321614 RepID=A0A7U2FGH6_PHANO|nr:hypothetical protein SNOG_16591 [Parastagonospora nodorum SN15]KAH3917350.1 hypothetical protein HBH56_055810 [Parastagonospora nodorum]EAT92624.1 hypothetical protein SNOG_16591 [Parastagonospora nodorum SN15]KAH3935742.1 hypothetical protein HBH54_041620 [Parastagonospora nodorum]KAH4140014.1 hypothetical protein HBH45_081490 [Parastagonospora nodorum]KAH4155564.1 hypothetical protein HBH44_135410 [Parastagonospora nodorum]
MSTPQAWSGPGIILSFFKLLDSPTISEETLEDWFGREYAPALIASGVVKKAWLYQAANADYDKQHLIVYNVPELAQVQAGKIQEVPRTSNSGLFEGTVDDYIEIETRIYSFVQLYEKSAHGEEAAPVMMLAMVQPAQGGEADLDAWYKDEHNEQMSKEPGYWRTSRFSLLHQHSTGSQQNEKLSFLAVHEFGEENALGTEVKPLDPMTDWTKKVMASAKGIDAAIYHKQRGFGDS